MRKRKRKTPLPPLQRQIQERMKRRYWELKVRDGLTYDLLADRAEIHGFRAGRAAIEEVLNAYRPIQNREEQVALAHALELDPDGLTLALTGEPKIVYGATATARAEAHATAAEVSGQTSS